LKKITAGALRESLRNWFPEREFFMRSQGQVRFITITSRMQIAAASLVVAVIGGWALSMGVMASASTSRGRALVAARARSCRGQVGKPRRRLS
jgi:hypothetical protein